MWSAVKILIGVIVFALVVFEIVSLIRDIKARKHKNNSNKEDEVDGNSH